MDWNLIWAAIGTGSAIIIALISGLAVLLGKINKKFEEIHVDLRQLDNRLSRMEGYLQGRDVKFNGTEGKKI